MNHVSLALLISAATPLMGCDFFAAPPPDPAEDGLLSCGEDQPLDALSSADSLRVDIEGATGVRIATSFGDPELAAVLRIDGADVGEHLGEFWDPLAQESVLTGSFEPGLRGQVELYAPDGGAMSGSLRMECSGAETCWNLTDDNGDGLVDCADPLCARAADCEESQEPLETETLNCTADFEEVDVPVLRPIDDQRTLYQTSPLGEGVQPVVSFWGGAEVLFAALPAQATQATVRVGGAGMLCVGTPAGVAVSCERSQLLSDGDEATFGPGEMVWMEPRGPTWESLTVQVDCGSSR